eukprot:scaffold79340_cov56-Phaeocystis_antarctica.AAC.2
MLRVLHVLRDHLQPPCHPHHLGPQRGRVRQIFLGAVGTHGRLGVARGRSALLGGSRNAIEREPSRERSSTGSVQHVALKAPREGSHAIRAAAELRAAAQLVNVPPTGAVRLLHHRMLAVLPSHTHRLHPYA